MKQKLLEIKEEALNNIGSSTDIKQLEDLRVKYLGKKGELTHILKQMGTLPAEERPIMGEVANSVRAAIEKSLEDTKSILSAKELEQKLLEEKLDVTMPGTSYKIGHKHPMTVVLDDIKELFIGLGYEIAEGPEIEFDYYNFGALNIPKNHPAKDEQDTFYISDKIVLRTQTSSVQVRTMEKGKLPIKIIAPGKVFRSDAVDATHAPTFHQLEGLVIDEGITMGDLKGALQDFTKELFGTDTVVRFRPHHFQFTEPSAEMDVQCFICKGKGCRTCKDSGYIELLGCGMVHPNVLRMSGIDPEKYSGFAFGMGVERIAMKRYGITDLRLLFENDVNFLKQF